MKHITLSRSDCIPTGAAELSYYTRLELEWDDTEEARSVEEEAIVERVRLYAVEQNVSEDILDDLRVALEGPHNNGIGFNKMYSHFVIDMLEFLSLGFPKTRFVARGAGEDLLDVWIREFKNGETILSYGPWGEFA